MAKQPTSTQPLSAVFGDAIHQLLTAGMDLAKGSRADSLAIASGLLGGSVTLAGRVAGGIDHSVREVTKDVWQSTESLFELRMSRLLNSLQIPTSRDVNELRARVDRLSTLLEEAKQTSAPKRRRKKSS